MDRERHPFRPRSRTPRASASDHPRDRRDRRRDGAGRLGSRVGVRSVRIRRRPRRRRTPNDYDHGSRHRRRRAPRTRSVPTLADTRRPPAAVDRRRLAGGIARAVAREDHRRDRRRAARLRLARVEWARQSRVLRLAAPCDGRDGTTRPRGRGVHHRRERLPLPVAEAHRRVRSTRVEGRVRAARDRDARRVRERWEQRRAAARVLGRRADDAGSSARTRACGP